MHSSTADKFVDFRVQLVITSHGTGQGRLLKISKCISWLHRRLQPTLRVCNHFDNS